MTMRRLRDSMLVAAVCTTIILSSALISPVRASHGCLLWSGWSEVPGDGRTDGSGPAVVVFPGYVELDLFVTGTDEAIYTNVWSGGVWSGWNVVPGGGTAAGGTGPAVAVGLYTGQLYLFRTGVDGRIFVNIRTDFINIGRVWSGWFEVPGDGRAFGAGPAAAFLPTQQQLYLFVRGVDGRLFMNVLRDPTDPFPYYSWSGWSEVPGDGRGIGAPAAVVFNGDVHLFVTGGGGRIYENVLSGASGTWTGWVEVPGGGYAEDAAGPGAAAIESPITELNLFVRGFEGRIYSNSFSGGVWSGWSEVPGDGRATAAAGPAAAGYISLFVTGAGNRIFRNECSPTA